MQQAIELANDLTSGFRSYRNEEGKGMNLEKEQVSLSA